MYVCMSESFDVCMLAKPILFYSLTMSFSVTDLLLVFLFVSFSFSLVRFHNFDFIIILSRFDFADAAAMIGTGAVRCGGRQTTSIEYPPPMLDDTEEPTVFYDSSYPRLFFFFIDFNYYYYFFSGWTFEFPASWQLS